MRSRVNERDWDRANVFVGGGGGAKTPTLDPVCIRETPEKMIVWSLPPQMKNPRYGPEYMLKIFSLVSLILLLHCHTQIV